MRKYVPLTTHKKQIDQTGEEDEFYENVGFNHWNRTA
jgi:hypothetical protein